MTNVAPTAMLDPALLAGIGDLELLARTVVDGFMHGRHRSLRTGQSNWSYHTRPTLGRARKS